MSTTENGWTKGIRCADCGHNEGTDANGQCRFMFIASDPSQVVDTSPTSQCPHYCPRSTGELIARKHLVFADYNKPLSTPGQGLAADIDSAIQADFEQLAALRKAAVQLVIPYEALLIDSESRKWIAPQVWTAIETGVAALREVLGDK